MKVSIELLKMFTESEENINVGRVVSIEDILIVKEFRG